MGIKARLEAAPITASAGSRGESALDVSKKLIADNAQVWLVDAADVRGGPQKGKVICTFTRIGVNTVGVFFVRQPGKPDMLVKCSIDSGRLSKTAYGVALASRFPEITTPNGESVSDVAAYIKRPENRGASIDILTVQQALAEWPQLSSKNPVNK